MYDRRQFNWLPEDGSLIRRVALTLAACQLVALLTVGALIWYEGGDKAGGAAIAAQAGTMR